MTATVLDNHQITHRLAELNKSLSPSQYWRSCEDQLCKTFLFDSFVNAFGWMSQIAIEAERMNHHPNWLNIYNRVEVKLTTHESEGITERDFLLAATMDSLIEAD